MSTLQVNVPTWRNAFLSKLKKSKPWRATILSIALLYVFFTIIIYTWSSDSLPSRMQFSWPKTGEQPSSSSSSFSSFPGDVVENKGVEAHIYTDGVVGNTNDKSLVGECPFDNQIPTYPLIQRLYTEPDMKFDWSEWLDLSATRDFEKGRLDPKFHPVLSQKSLKEVDFPISGHSNPQDVAMTARLFCKHYLNAPAQLIVLPNSEAVSQSGVSKKGTRFYLDPVDSSRAHLQYGQTEYRRPPVLDPLVPAMQNNTRLADRMLVDIPYNLFEFSASKRMDELEAIKDEDDDASEYLKTIKEANSRVADSGKHFLECDLSHDPLGHGTHFDWRFFRAVPQFEEQAIINRALMRAWQKFAESEGILYWISHGSLIGWWWNGLALPWDSDNDIQVPAYELDRLAREYNGTLVIEDPLEGNRKFFIDVSPWFVERRRGNGKNVIDARFIDVETGVYIDITGLSRTTVMDKRVNCKNNHRYDLEEISPLRRSMYDTSVTYVPHEVNNLLLAEYKHFKNDRFQRWAYSAELKMWHLTIKCAQYLRRFNEWALVSCPASELKDHCEQQEEPLHTCDQALVAKHEKMKPFIAIREREKETWIGSAFTNNTRSHAMVDEFTKYHPLEGEA